MAIDLTTLTLFPIFPRRVGIPSYIVHNERQFEHYILKYNGTPEGCHVGVYDCNSRPIIDKLLFDFDSGKKGEKIKDAFEEVKILVCELLSRKFAVIPVFSGCGFHIYVLLHPVEVDPEVGKFLLKEVQLSFVEDYKCVDRQKIGVINTMIRVPNTLNIKRKRWCCYLPLHFVEWTLKEILEYAQAPHYLTYKYNGQRYPLVTDLAGITLKNINIKEVKITEDFEEAPPKVPPLHLLKDLIRPCVYEELIRNRNPAHFVRLSLVAELRHLGFTQKQVFEICKSLRWADFDPDYTMYQIQDIYERKLLPPSCKTLRKYVRCTNCGWYYFWLE